MTRWRVSFASLAIIERERIDLERVAERHRGIAAGPATASGAGPQSAAAGAAKRPR